MSLARLIQFFITLENVLEIPSIGTEAVSPTLIRHHKTADSEALIAEPSGTTSLCWLSISHKCRFA